MKNIDVKLVAICSKTSMTRNNIIVTQAPLFALTHSKQRSFLKTFWGHLGDISRSFPLFPLKWEYEV